MSRPTDTTGALLEPVRDEARRLDARAFGAAPQSAWSDVVVHTGPRSARLAEQQHAAAFTVGRHVVFNQGRYDPASARGQALLAHELTHVQQQRRGGGDLDAGFRMPGSALARQAGAGEAHASAVGHGEAAGTGGATAVGVARQDKTAEEEDWATFLKRRARSTVKTAVGAVEAVPTYAAGAVDSVTWIPYAAMDAGDTVIDSAGDYLGVSEEARGYVKNAVPGAVALRTARDFAKSEGLVDPNSGVPSLTLAVGRGGDAVEGYVDDAFGLPKEEGFFTDRELSLLGTTIAIDVGLSFVAVEEIVLALKVVGGAGAGKAIYDAVKANPQGFYRSRDFWVAIAQAVLYLVGIGAAKLRAKIVMLVADILSTGVALVTAGMKLAEDFMRPDSPERDQALKADVKALLQVVVSAIRQFMTHNRAPAPKSGGGAEPGGSGGSGGGKPAAQTPPAVDAKPAAPTKPAAPAPTTDPKPHAQKPAAKPAPKAAAPAAPVATKAGPVKKKAAPVKNSPEGAGPTGTAPKVAPDAKKPAPPVKPTGADPTVVPEKPQALPAKKTPLPEKKAPLPEKTAPLPEKKAPLPEKSKKTDAPKKKVPPPEKKTPLPEKPKKGSLPEKPKKGSLPEKPKKGSLPEKAKKGALPEKPATEAVPAQAAMAAGDAAPTQKKAPKKAPQASPKSTAPAKKDPAKKDSAKKDPAKKDPAKKDPAKKDPAKAKTKAPADQAPAKKGSPKKSPEKAPAAAKASTPPKKTKKSGAGDTPAGATKTAPAKKKKTAKTGPAKPRKSKAQVNAEVAALRKRAKELTKKAVTDKSAAEEIEGLYRAASDEALAQLEPDYLATRETDRRRALNPEADDIRAGRKEFPRMPHEATVVVTNNDGSAAYFAPEGPEGSYGPVSPARRDFRSGGTSTPERRKEVGMNRANQESHTEAKAVQLPLKKGQTMTIMGQYDPCTSCRGFMQRKADVSGAKIVYLWMGGQETFVPTVKK